MNVNTVTILATLIDRLDRAANAGTEMIPWACPVPSFGDLWRSRVATLGLNPSNREFADEAGNELQGGSRRFPTLKSLGLGSWSEVDTRHLRLILDSCREYFARNPYNRWFKRLDQVVAGTNTSYYDVTNRACHLDLIPYATECKWTKLTKRQRSSLLAIAGDTLGLLLRDAPVETLILNGKGVVEEFQEIAAIRLERYRMADWSLPRRTGANVSGFAYRGVVDALSGIRLGHNLLILGFNHNLQSSFGVTVNVICSIRAWITGAVRESLRR